MGSALGRTYCCMRWVASGWPPARYRDGADWIRRSDIRPGYGGHRLESQRNRRHFRGGCLGEDGWRSPRGHCQDTGHQTNDYSLHRDPLLFLEHGFGSNYTRFMTFCEGKPAPPIFCAAGQECGNPSMAGPNSVRSLGFVNAIEAQQCPDEELVRRLAEGQREALDPLHERYGPVLTSLAARQLDRPAAEEIVQDVFLTVWQHAGNFDPRPWPVLSALP